MPSASPSIKRLNEKQSPKIFFMILINMEYYASKKLIEDVFFNKPWQNFKDYLTFRIISLDPLFIRLI